MTIRVLLTRDEVEKVTAPVTVGYCLPPRCFTSEDFFDAEMQNIFLKEWVCVGRADRVSTPGDYFTLNIGPEPLIICRDDQNNVRAFNNVCPHRGSILIEGEGQTHVFACPYHGWRFSNNGHMVGAPHMGKTVGFDRKTCTLPEIKAEVWEGFAFVNFDRNAAPLAPRLRHLSEKIKRYQFATFKTDKTLVVENACNWKIGVENAIDEYHAYIVHKSLEPTKSYKLDDTFAEGEEGGLWGINFTPAIKAHPYVTGTSMLTSPFPAVPGLNSFELQSFNVLGVFPNAIIALNPDSIITLLFFPLAPNKVSIHVAMNYPKSTFDIPDFRKHADEAMESLVFTNEQDMDGCRLAQKGLYSSAAAQGRLSFLEDAVRYFDSYVARKMSN